MLARNWYVVHANFANGTALSVSHQERGLNYGKSVGPDAVLVNATE